MKLIELYKEWMEKKRITNRKYINGLGGLCNAVPIEYLSYVKLFEPESMGVSISYWASELPTENISEVAMYWFNPLRQTIVLLICAMCDEL